MKTLDDNHKGPQIGLESLPWQLPFFSCLLLMTTLLTLGHFPRCNCRSLDICIVPAKHPPGGNGQSGEGGPNQCRRVRRRDIDDEQISRAALVAVTRS